MAYTQKNNPFPVTSCGRRRPERVDNMNTPLHKDQLVKTTKHGDGNSRVKPVKELDENTQSQTIKNPDKSTITNRYKKGELVDTLYNPKPLNPKNTKKLKTPKIPRSLKNVEAPEYNPVVNVSEKDEMVHNYNKNSKNNKAKSNKKKTRKTLNLVTGKINKTA